MIILIMCYIVMNLECDASDPQCQCMPQQLDSSVHIGGLTCRHRDAIFPGDPGLAQGSRGPSKWTQMLIVRAITKMKCISMQA